jgi:hypothetical protein
VDNNIYEEEMRYCVLFIVVKNIDIHNNSTLILEHLLPSSDLIGARTLSTTLSIILSMMTVDAYDKG